MLFRFLFFAIPCGAVAYWGIKSYFGKSPNDSSNREQVEAWFNEKSYRWETPAPWNPDFRKLGETALKKVDKNMVHDSPPT